MLRSDARTACLAALLLSCISAPLLSTPTSPLVARHQVSSHLDSDNHKTKPVCRAHQLHPVPPIDRQTLLQLSSFRLFHFHFIKTRDHPSVLRPRIASPTQPQLPLPFPYDRHRGKLFYARQEHRTVRLNHSEV